MIGLLTLCLPLTACGFGNISIHSHAATDRSGDALQAKVVFLAGRDSHGSLAHEHQSGSQLLATTLREQQPGFETINVYGGWPEDNARNLVVNAIVWSTGSR